MEVVAAPNGTNVPPFRNHDVREWSRIDSLTGVLERARLETDHWSANTSNTSHEYGKVVDSRARSNADGAVQQARRQLEVFQSTVPGGHLQVIKSHTVSSSRWSSTSKTLAEHHFGDLELSLNPLDLTSQKSKATVGRSVGRRPPSRPRNRDETSSIPLTDASVNLRRVSRLCHQIHENAVRQTFGKYRSPIQERGSGDGVEITEIPSAHGELPLVNGRCNLQRTKSTSSEELSVQTSTKDKSNKSIEDLEDLEQLQTWRRTSKIRRSLQFPKQNKQVPTKPPDLPENTGSVRKIKEDLETGRRLSTALRGNNVDLEALDQILQSITEDKDGSSKKQKRNSFVTVESLQEVRGRLRRTSSPSSEVYPIKNNNEPEKLMKEEEIDDGIVTEDTMSAVQPQSRVRSYVYGMETMLNKKNVLGTGSLESRGSKQQNGTTGSRTEDWYNRRKSYGFEQVHNQQASINMSKMESSTDSGICRSNEIVPSINEIHSGNVKRFTSIFEQKKESPFLKNPKKDFEGVTITIPISNENEIKRHSIAVDEYKYDNKFRHTNTNDLYQHEVLDKQQKQKKVEFCKTEVHFAADSGKVNIVATDEKPPPNNNFRRRRRNSASMYNQFLSDMNKNGFPMLHFGDSSYEKNLLGIANSDDNNVQPDVPSSFDKPYTTNNTVTVSTNQTLQQNYQQELMEDEPKEYMEESPNPKGILKNKPIKPKPYLLGDDNFFTNIPEKEENGIWGVRLKPVQNKVETPMWRSTVMLKNTLFDKQEESSDNHKGIRIVPLNQNDVKAQIKGYSTKVNIGGGEAIVINENTQKDKNRHTTWPRHEENVRGIANLHVSQPSEADKIQKPTRHPGTRNPHSPVVLRKTYEPKKQDLKMSFENEKLSSPFLVNKELQKPAQLLHKKSIEEQSPNITRLRDKRSPTPAKVVRSYNSPTRKKSPQKEGVPTQKQESIRQKSPSRSVLRNPRKSELAYFGVKSSPSPKPMRREAKNRSPIYENIDEVKEKTRSSKKEFDSRILDELTKAADQILQAVNGYAEDIHKHNAHEENYEQEKLDTISETKSWKQRSPKSRSVSSRTEVHKAKLKHTSSTSSVESTPERRQANLEQSKKKTNSETSGRAATKARRLQRASSREALLQSHGSSSEDLPIAVEVPLRKPRLVRKSKVTQVSSETTRSSTVSSSRKESNKNNERIQVGALPEIRHQSTIRSTAEKLQSRERNKNKDSSKKKAVTKSNVLSKNERNRSISKESTNHHISSPNIKKCSRAEGLAK